MLSTMTKTENFPLPNQSGCNASTFQSYISAPLKSNQGDVREQQEEYVCRTYRQFVAMKREVLSDEEDQWISDDEEEFVSLSSPSHALVGGSLNDDILDLTSDIENFELEDEQNDLKIVNIDPNVLKLDFDNLSNHDRTSSEVSESDGCRLDLSNVINIERRFTNSLSGGSCISETNENTKTASGTEYRASHHHFSGGGLISNTSHESKDYVHFLDIKLSENPARKRYSNHFSGGSIVSIKEVLDDTEKTLNINTDTFNDKQLEYIKPKIDVSYLSNENLAVDFFNQVSPSSPLKFTLPQTNTSVPDEVTCSSIDVPNVVSESEIPMSSTNPFKNLMEQTIGFEDNFTLPSTNPFNTNFESSSLSEIVCGLNEKSPSQCSTRPASPILQQFSSAPSPVNPFKEPVSFIEETPLNFGSVVNEEPSQKRPEVTTPIFLNRDGSLQNFSDISNAFISVQQSFPQQLPNRSSFILALPVFPVFQKNCYVNQSNSSTQTSEVNNTPLYQNSYIISNNHIEKYISSSNHSEHDLKCLMLTMKHLKTSGWYYENLSWQESVVLLKNTEPGTFLIRDSSDPNFLFSLSVQTIRGPTSVRLHYINGQFRLDAEEKLIPHMPFFSSVLELIDYYIENTDKNKMFNIKKLKKSSDKNKFQKSKEQVWIDSQGNVYSNILLSKPLYKKNHFSSLQHLTRLAINKEIKKKKKISSDVKFKVTPVYNNSYPFNENCSYSDYENGDCIFEGENQLDILPLPGSLISYLKEYPYCH